ncbi:hypothetical protein Q0N12_13820 [Rossellomorea marisflavi]|uniref:hypothetical protein n=1 Tax=Rossellomorea marisflavi TaxID=189381 RepID=UPI00345968B8
MKKHFWVGILLTITLLLIGGCSSDEKGAKPADDDRSNEETVTGEGTNEESTSEENESDSAVTEDDREEEVNEETSAEPSDEEEETVDLEDQENEEEATSTPQTIEDNATQEEKDKAVAIVTDYLKEKGELVEDKDHFVQYDGTFDTYVIVRYSTLVSGHSSTNGRYVVDLKTKKVQDFDTIMDSITE